MLAHKVKKKVSKEFSTEEKTNFLLQPHNYPFYVDKVAVKETHMSLVFLADGFVYKMKKPVRYDLFDHRSLHSRFINCREEIKINKQLAKNIYVGLAPLVLNKKEQLQLEAEGEVIEWFIKMKRIPEESMLDFAIRNNSIDENGLKNAADLLVNFYKTSPGVSISLNRLTKKMEGDISSIGQSLVNPLFNFSSQLVHEIESGLIAFVAANDSLFVKRIRNKKIIDTHGDLRPEHICLMPSPAIIDRLEFSSELRVMDVAEELSFLSMECEIIGNRSPGEFFIDTYKRTTGDYFPPSLCWFYKTKKACLRSYLVARHVLEPQYQNDVKWLSKANVYLNLAKKYYQHLGS